MLFIAATSSEDWFHGRFQARGLSLWKKDDSAVHVSTDVVETFMHIYSPKTSGYVLIQL